METVLVVLRSDVPWVQNYLGCALSLPPMCLAPSRICSSHDCISILARANRFPVLRGLGARTLVGAYSGLYQNHSHS